MHDNDIECMAISNQKSEDILSEQTNTPHNPIYKKPKTSVLIDKGTMILSGNTFVLESEGNGYLTS